MTATSNLAEKLLQDVSVGISKDIDCSTSGFKLVEKVNNAAIKHTSEMLQTCDDLTSSVSHLRNKYEECLPLLQEIDEIDQRTIELEKVIRLLDQYTLHLEQRLRSI
ncbi:hypothetical protein P9112_011665 [Eukaryota sp. TZLM1-RC]